MFMTRRQRSIYLLRLKSMIQAVVYLSMTVTVLLCSVYFCFNYDFVQFAWGMIAGCAMCGFISLFLCYIFINVFMRRK